jgi:hypothetical protein
VRGTVMSVFFKSLSTFIALVYIDWHLKLPHKEFAVSKQKPRDSVCDILSYIGSIGNMIEDNGNTLEFC